MKLIGD
jgi:hypothetical protein